MSSTVYKPQHASVDALSTGHAGPGLREGVAVAMARVLAWSARARQRKHLAKLDEHLLKDIGVEQGEVWAEISKPFWKI